MTIKAGTLPGLGGQAQGSAGNRDGTEIKLPKIHRRPNRFMHDYLVDKVVGRQEIRPHRGLPSGILQFPFGARRENGRQERPKKNQSLGPKALIKLC